MILEATEYFKRTANKALRIAWAVDWPRTAVNLVLSVSGAYGKCYVGTIVVLIVFLRIGVLLGSPWAVEMDAAGMLRALESLDPEVVAGFDHMGRLGVSVALHFWIMGRMVGVVFFNTAPVLLGWVRFRNIVAEPDRRE